MPPSKLPAILVRNGDERKTSKGPNGQTQFDTDFVIQIRAIVSDITAEAAQDGLDILGSVIEDVLLRDIGIRGETQDFPAIDTTTDYSSDGRVHFAAISIALHFQIYEAFEPDVNNTLERMQLTVDLRTPFDPNGTYPDPPFPDAIPPAPRTTGPDGRAEGVIDLDFSDQE
ncbi:conserved hypothetical protein [Paraburkholderia caribensis]|nr:conserved hypothetical protein [Paraburkholderia caribensis]